MDDTGPATIEKKATSTISAKSQITNPKADTVPIALRVCWENKGVTAAPQRKSEGDSAMPLAKAAPKSGPSVPVSVQIDIGFLVVLEFELMASTLGRQVSFPLDPLLPPSVQTKDDVYEVFLKEMGRAAVIAFDARQASH
jgi:WW domain-binding protein 11